MSNPRVTVGLCVYNGERYLRGAIESLLAQDHPSFELLVSDNASQDGTEAICREYAARDPRVRYSRNAENIGAPRNFHHVFRISRGEFFCWAAHDDYWAPTFLSRCAGALEANPEAVLAYPQMQMVDAEGQARWPVARNVITQGASLERRFHEVLHGAEASPLVYGLIRSSALRRTRPFGLYLGADITMLAELALQGPFIEIPETLWSYRHNGRIDPEWFDRTKVVVADRWIPRHMPRAVLCKNMLEMVMSASLPAHTRVALAGQVVRWYLLELHLFRHGRNLVRWRLGQDGLDRLLERLHRHAWYKRLRSIGLSIDQTESS